MDKKPDLEKRPQILEIPRNLKQKVALDVQSAVEATIADLEQLLQSEKPVTIRVEGKSGANKTYYSEQLKNRIEELGRKCEKISTDDYYIKVPGLDEYRHDLSKLASDIENAQREGKAVIVEGIIPKSSGKFDIKPNYKVFFEAPFDRRLATRIQRQFIAKNKDPKEVMSGVARAAGENMDSFSKYEDLSPDDDTNLLVDNKYEMPEKPQIYIEGEEFVFETSGRIAAKISLSDKQIQGLKQLGIKEKS